MPDANWYPKFPGPLPNVKKPQNPQPKFSGKPLAEDGREWLDLRLNQIRLRIAHLVLLPFQAVGLIPQKILQKTAP